MSLVSPRVSFGTKLEQKTEKTRLFRLYSVPRWLESISATEHIFAKQHYLSNTTWNIYNHVYMLNKTKNRRDILTVDNVIINVWVIRYIFHAWYAYFYLRYSGYLAVTRIRFKPNSRPLTIVILYPDAIDVRLRPLCHAGMKLGLKALLDIMTIAALNTLN